MKLLTFLQQILTIIELITVISHFNHADFWRRKNEMGDGLFM